MWRLENHSNLPHHCSAHGFIIEAEGIKWAPAQPEQLWQSPAASAVQNTWTLRPNTHVLYKQALNTIYRQFQSSFGFILASQL